MTENYNYICVSASSNDTVEESEGTRYRVPAPSWKSNWH
jgi:hypothetical protein